jgi:hypothetical protein
MQATNSLHTDSFQILHSTIARIEVTYTPETIRAYIADFATFITN